MKFRYSFLIFIALLLASACNRDDLDVVTTIAGELPPTDSLTSTTSLAGTVRDLDDTYPSNATAEILYGDFVIASQRVNSGDGTWNFNDITVSDDPNVLVRITSPGWVPAIRSITNRDDVVRYSNVVLIDRGPTTTIHSSSDVTLTEGLLSVTIPANSYLNYTDAVDLSLNAYSSNDISNLNRAIASPFLVDEGGVIKSLTNPTIYALVATGENGERLQYNVVNSQGIELSTLNAGPTSLIYVLNQVTGYWENYSTLAGPLNVKQFGYIAVAQASNSVRVKGSVRQPDGAGISGVDVFAFVTDPNSSIAFALTATDGNGDYEFYVPSGSEGTVVIQPGVACREKNYDLLGPVSELDLGTYVVDVAIPTLIQGFVEGCSIGVGSTEDLAIEMTGIGVGRILIPLRVPISPDGSFSSVYEVCHLDEDITFVPIVQSGPNAGRQGERLVVAGGTPLDNLTLKYCDTLVSDALMFMSFEGPTVLSTTPTASTIHPDTIEIIGLTLNPQGEMRWKLALSSSKVHAMFSHTDRTFKTVNYVDAVDLTYDGVELMFTFIDAPGVLTDHSDGSMENRLGGGAVRVKVD